MYGIQSSASVKSFKRITVNKKTSHDPVNMIPTWTNAPVSRQMAHYWPETKNNSEHEPFHIFGIRNLNILDVEIDFILANRPKTRQSLTTVSSHQDKTKHYPFQIPKMNFSNMQGYRSSQYSRLLLNPKGLPCTESIWKNVHLCVNCLLALP